MTFRYLTGNVVPVPEGSVVPAYQMPWCFGCGPDNEHGMHIQARADGDKVVCEYVFPKRFEGGPDMAHGGAVAAFYDDIMGSVLIAHKIPGVTANLSVNYRRPHPVGVPIRAEAWVAERRGRKGEMEAVGYLKDQILAEVTGLFLHIPQDPDAPGLTDRQRATIMAFSSEQVYP